MGNNQGREALIPGNSAGVPGAQSDASFQSGASLQPAGNNRPQIVYALIARSMSETSSATGLLPKEVLCEYSSLEQNSEAQIRDLLPKFTPDNASKSYTFGDNHGLHYIFEDSLWFVCLADKAYGNARPFSCLKALQEAFQRQKSGANFRDEMKKIVSHWNSPEAAVSERVLRMNQAVNDIHENLLDSLDNLMERGEKIDVLVQRSLVLSENSSSFARESRVLHNRIRWRNLKSFIILGLLVFVVIFVIVLMSCGGFSFKDC
mmetsp:Transcript_3121/g.5137  ORF Transcript_3121/g.5137 Transcript_3121/m.5137 type:complete len:262 (-) Transcript_3121:60-845(-)|eukprot:CAMPEP_0169114304 /NCGR_PEP_ID=MMETSP1015-20121227/28672_1 /TAXON_ID=342587 /ORGANISM="Karlodinium micrum, Strain CCMP2283" /LENGTH=261 /DNA_ID=CAMNT_0009176549 /DNA_START=59 /DNA_END=844 /DNA_ORIENTATION=-